jgi:hypothetical protein
VRIAMLLSIVGLALGVTWLAGEEHRRNCIAEGKRSCSVLPWDSGTSPSTAESPTRRGNRPTLTQQGCINRTLENMAAETTDQIVPLPPECR